MALNVKSHIIKKGERIEFENLTKQQRKNLSVLYAIRSERTRGYRPTKKWMEKYGEEYGITQADLE